MQKVSRSFALVVPWVETPLNHYLAIAYLLCRVADNIEDCLQPIPWKRKRFAEMEHLLAEPERTPEILTAWQNETWLGLTAEEQRMMSLAGGQPLWQVYGDIPPASRRIIQHWVLEMATGMSHLDVPHKAPVFANRGGVQVLVEESDYNHYCYIVAGTVGHLATELVIDYFSVSDQAAERLLSTCEACGRALQKTNIVKDFAKDLKRGVSYLPERWLAEADYAPLALQGAPPIWSRKVLDNVLQELRQSTDYILALPYHATGYRMASLLCLLPAYQTILLAAQRQETLFTSLHQVKISRPTMARCLEDAQRLLTDNQAILDYGQQINQAVEAVFSRAEPELSPL